MIDCLVNLDGLERFEGGEDNTSGRRQNTDEYLELKIGNQKSTPRSGEPSNRAREAEAELLRAGIPAPRRGLKRLRAACRRPPPPSIPTGRPRRQKAPGNRGQRKLEAWTC